MLGVLDILNVNHIYKKADSRVSHLEEKNKAYAQNYNRPGLQKRFWAKIVFVEEESRFCRGVQSVIYFRCRTIAT